MSKFYWTRFSTYFIMLFVFSILAIFSENNNALIFVASMLILIEINQNSQFGSSGK